jgi:hypothetical protein
VTANNEVERPGRKREQPILKQYHKNWYGKDQSEDLGVDGKSYQKRP